MKLSDFDFDLPQELIALRPVSPRPASRLLVAQGDMINIAQVSDIRSFLRDGDLLVLNDTKVLPARLAGVRVRGDVSARVEVTLTKEVSEDLWQVLAKPARKLREGDMISFGPHLSGRVDAAPVDGFAVIAFDYDAPGLLEALALAGTMPLPPYIASKRAPDADDLEAYQTVFAKTPGAVAAPTASLHFDVGLLSDLRRTNIGFCYVTLHVGIGTFLPVKVDNIADHKMHAEWGHVSQEAATQINETIKNGGRVIPVGTTALRLIESAATAHKGIGPWTGETDIFITPGYAFKIADGLMTNFHLPKSTLMMLVSALMGRARIANIYERAIEEKMRFFSYGDSSLLFPDEGLRSVSHKNDA